MSFDFDLISAAAIIIALMVSIIGHEIMHGLSAYFYGDTTAKDLGRLSVNPIKHIDPIGSIALPLLLFLSGAPFLFGWAKPVPIDARQVINRGGHFAMVVVSIAGVAFNLLLAFIVAQFVDNSTVARFNFNVLNEATFMQQLFFLFVNVECRFGDP